MSGRDTQALVWDVLAAVLAEDQDGLHELMQPLDRDELDFLVTSMLSLVAGMVVSTMKQAGHPAPRGEALRLVREFAAEAALRDAVRQPGEDSGR